MDNSDLKKKSQENKAALRDFEKTGTDAVGKLGEAFGVNTGKIDQMLSSVRGLGVSLEQSGKAGAAAFGKMLQGIVEKDGRAFYYVNGKLSTKPGLTKIGDDYYFVASNGRCATGKYYAWATKCDLPVGNYEFGADGKMLNGFVTKADGIYYYVTGKLADVGLHYIDGYYYCVTSSGKLVTNQSYYVWATNDLLIEKSYTFDELGRIVG